MSNIMTKEDTITAVAALGAASGAGDNSRHELALTTARAVAQGALITGKGSTDIKDVVLAYQRGRKEASYSLDIKESSDKSLNVQVSKLNAVAKCALHPSGEGVETLEVALDVAKRMRGAGACSLSLFDALVKVSREQRDYDAGMTEDQIEAALTPTNDKDPYNEADELEKILKTMRRLRDGTEGTETSEPKAPFPSPQLGAAIAQVEQRLGDVLGNSPAIRALTLTGMDIVDARAVFKAAQRKVDKSK